MDNEKELKAQNANFKKYISQLLGLIDSTGSSSSTQATLTQGSSSIGVIKDYFMPTTIIQRVEIDKLGEGIIHQVLSDYIQLQSQIVVLNDLLQEIEKQDINIQDSIHLWEDYLSVLRKIKKFDLNMLHDKATLEEDVDRETMVERIRATKMAIKEYTKSRGKIMDQINFIHYLLSHIEEFIEGLHEMIPNKKLDQKAAMEVIQAFKDKIYNNCSPQVIKEIMTKKKFLETMEAKLPQLDDASKKSSYFVKNLIIKMKYTKTSYVQELQASSQNFEQNFPSKI